MLLRALSASFLFISAAAVHADPPKVAADIAPVHSLVSRVMQGIAEPDLILPLDASPHGYAMRPSEARALSEAELVIWIGEDLTPWFGRAIEAASEGKAAIELLDIEGTNTLGFREGVLFEHDDHEDHAEKHDDHDHAEKHDDHDHGASHDKHEDHDDHAHKDEDDDHEGHAHGDTDPHAWLDPENAALWTQAIAEKLAELDPDNAQAYLSNASAARAELEALETEISALIAPAKGAKFVVFHDAYHYFEHHFGIEALGSISIGDASAPSAARLEEIQEIIEHHKVKCVFAEPQMSARTIDTVTEGLDVKVGELDPIGIDLTPGPDFYPALIRNLASSIADCAK